MHSPENSRPESIPAAELLGPLPDPDVREVRAVAISTIDGSAAISGNTQSMGNETDTELFQAARRWSDVILVGAGTVRDEDYGGVKVTAEQQSARVALGQSPVPPIAVLSRTFTLNPAMRFFTEATSPPLILAPHDSCVDPHLQGVREELEGVGARVLDCGDGSAQAIVNCLHDQGFNRIGLEGGPLVFGEMFAEDLVDVFHLTIDPILTSHLERPLLELPDTAASFTRHFTLEDVAATADGALFLRYGRA